MLFYQEVAAKQTTFALALAQIRVDGGDPAANLDRAAAAIATAAAGGADVVLLPEALDLGWSHPSAADLATEIPDGSSCTRLASCAREHGVWLCAGLVERSGDEIFNAAVLFDRAGDLVLKHRKINELDFAREIYRTGEGAAVANTEFGRVGVMICADAFIAGHTVSRALGAKGAKLILSPCAWAVPADHDNDAEPYGELWTSSYVPVAREFSLWIAAASNVGPVTGGAWRGRNCIGCSMLVDPRGEVVAKAPYGADAQVIVQAEFAPDRVR